MYSGAYWLKLIRQSEDGERSIPMAVKVRWPCIFLQRRSFSCITIQDTFPAPNVPAGSPSRGGDVAVYVLDINKPSLPTPF